MNIIVNKITTAVDCINTNRNYIGFELDRVITISLMSVLLTIKIDNKEELVC